MVGLNVFSRCLMVAVTSLLPGSAMAAQPPLDAPSVFRVAQRPLVLSVHAEGAQVYECKADAAGRPIWTFREPVATLINGGHTVGRH